MNKRYPIIVALALSFCACKKHAEIAPNAHTPSEVHAITYELLNTTINSVQYSHPLNLDLNHDGKIDFRLTSVMIAENGHSYLYLLINSATASQNKIVIKPEPLLVGNGFWVAPLDEGSAIQDNLGVGKLWNSDLTKVYLMNVMYQEYNNVFDGFLIGKKNKYLGLKFLINGQYHYGWLRVNHNLGEDKLTIYDYAFNNIPGIAILAGEK